VPQLRQAPGGHKSGGDQPTDISVSNRRVFLAPPLPEGQHEEMGTEHEDIKSSENPLTAEVISTLPLSGGGIITTDLLLDHLLPNRRWPIGRCSGWLSGLSHETWRYLSHNIC
jgi:hypothetical protein